MKISLFLIILLLAFASLGHAFTVDRLMVPSASMNKEIPVNVVMPKAYTDIRPLPSP
jgi:signal peptidase I